MSIQPKYRAWYKPKGIMIEPENLEAINFETKTIAVYKEMDGKGYNVLRMSDFELMQYTGRKDSNDKEIHHKDLWRFHGNTYMVEWDDEYAMFYFKHNGERATDDDHIKLFVSDQGEVIGNVFQGVVQA
ncbi:MULTISPECIES: YopX family protein [unclassified Paenibacillus]|uniref:YopX family protein n=1 Tax=unclassified Paenibacillus TaxID=185978 RepID=UPI0036AB8904